MIISAYDNIEGFWRQAKTNSVYGNVLEPAFSNYLHGFCKYYDFHFILANVSHFN